MPSTSHFERIRGVIQNSSLSGPDKLVLINTFAGIENGYLKGIADIFEQNPKWAEIFNDNRKKKEEAYNSGNTALLNEIIKEEKKYLNDLMYSSD